MDAQAWEDEVSALWSSARSGHLTDEEIVEQVDELATRCPYDDGTADFERGGARDSTGDPEAAVALYRSALTQGLDGIRRRECAIQLASSLRNLGQVDEAVEILTAERSRTSDGLDDAVTAFLALSLSSAGRDREGLGLALGALAPHLPRYQRSLAAYAEDLLPPDAA
jgi:tetratricopeptide (TPR) repeat protein